MITTNDNYACIIEGKLYYGNEKAAKDERMLQELGVNAIVDLIKYVRKSKEIQHSSIFKVLHIDVDDVPTNNIDWCEEPAKFIDDQLSQNNVVYVHCSKGISRSTALIIYYLMTRKKQGLKQTFTQIREIRNVASPNYGFMKGLSELEQKLFGKTTLSPVEYSINSISEVFPSVNREKIEQIYNETKNEFNDEESYTRAAFDRNIEPIGYYTIEKIFKKYGNKSFLSRNGCLFHHPFE